VLTEEQIAAIEKRLSPERLSKYSISAAGDKGEALKLYQRNTVLCEALYTPLQGLEICLRNSMNLELVSRFGDGWHNNSHAIFHHPATEMLHEARNALATDGKAITTGGLVAELSFGFWVAILGPKYDTSLWIPSLRRAFAHRPSSVQRREVQGALNAIRRLRNRVAHHEPIMHRHLDEDHELILRIIHWCCPETAQWVASQSRFPSVLG
jgi:hypothetical protein